MNLPSTRVVTPEDLAIQLTNLTGSHAVSVYNVHTEPRAHTAVLTCEFGRDFGAPAIELPGLAKWLRVNDRPIAVSDSDQVIADLPTREQDWFDRAGVSLCIPLVSDGVLLSVAVLHCSDGVSSLPGESLAGLHSWARNSTIAWREMMVQRRLDKESAAAYRSQQLSTAGQLAASVAHEVRNPLAGVRSIVQLVKDTHPTAERHAELLNHVLSEVDRVDHTVSGLLGLARPHDQVVAPCDLGVMTADAVEFVQTSTRRKDIHLSIRIQENSTVQVDPREFRQVVLNILLNASEACRPGDSIQVVVDRTRRGASLIGEVRVQDTGAGISPEIKNQIFEPFFTTKSSGSGLGLALCRELTRKHGGDIRVDSEVDVGTVVVLEYPADEPA